MAVVVVVLVGVVVSGIVGQDRLWASFCGTVRSIRGHHSHCNCSTPFVAGMRADSEGGGCERVAFGGGAADL